MPNNVKEQEVSKDSPTKDVEEIPCLVNPNGNSKITWEELNKKVDEIFGSLSGYSTDDIKSISSALVVKSKKHPLLIKQN